MARAALDWSAKRLAREADVGFATVTRFETGGAATISATVKAMQAAFEAHGVKFVGDFVVDVEVVERAAQDEKDVENV